MIAPTIPNSSEIPEEHTGSVIESLASRHGEMIDMVNNGTGTVRLIFQVPARGLIGYTTEFLTMTRGYGILNHTFDSYQPKSSGRSSGRSIGVLVSMENGTATPYSIINVEERGTIFVEPGTEIYEGMIVGEHNRDTDLTVKLTRAKQQSNIRTANKDTTVVIKKPRILTLEESLEYLDDDEYCEITPVSIRLRKKILGKSERERVTKKSKSDK